MTHPSSAKEGMLLATSRPGFPALPDTEDGPNNTVNRIRAGASSIVGTIQMGKLQQKSNNLSEAMLQLTEANEQLREAVEECEVGMIEGYPDLELASIDIFISAG